jgi:hypothetical protein
MIKRFYDYLGISENASIQEIKQAYHKKALLLHPDHNLSGGAKEEFMFLNNIYHILLIEKKNNKRKNTIRVKNFSWINDIKNILFAFTPLIFIWLMFLLLLDNASINPVNISLRLQTAVNLLMGMISVSSMQFFTFKSINSVQKFSPILRFLLGYTFSLFGFLLFQFQFHLVYSILFLTFLLISIALIIQLIANFVTNQTKCNSRQNFYLK